VADPLKCGMCAGVNGRRELKRAGTRVNAKGDEVFSIPVPERGIPLQSSDDCFVTREGGLKFR